ncbi:MAG: hypothetical protein KGL39_47225 [Patescibacteria group bacterium]|nr:hypothetical protein [Patescibacteria group bacterium]
MKMIQVSESALDSIRAMGERDKREIERLRKYMADAANMLQTAGYPGTASLLNAVLRESTDSHPIEKAKE